MSAGRNRMGPAAMRCLSVARGGSGMGHVGGMGRTVGLEPDRG